MSAFTLAEIDAEIARLKVEYDKLNHMASYGINSGTSARQAQLRGLKEIEDAIDRWQARRDALTGAGGIRNRGAVPC